MKRPKSIFIAVTVILMAMMHDASAAGRFAQENAPAKVKAVQVKGVLSEMLTRNTVLGEDDAVKIRYRTASKLSPILTIYNPDGTALPDYNGVKMREVSNTGIYEYEVTAKYSWGVGDFIVECSESTYGSSDSMVLTVKRLYTPALTVIGNSTVELSPAAQ